MASTELSARSERPIGLIATDAAAAAIARRLAAIGRRVLYLMLPPATPLARAPDLEAAATVADIGIGCDTVLLAIDDMDVLRGVLIGDEDRPGIAADLAPGSLIIDFSTRPPRELQSILGIMGMRGVSLVDAAIIGDVSALERGAGNVLAGGFPDAVDLAMPVLGELGSVERTGPLGSAQTAAALMGYVEAAHFSAQTEVLTVGAALGLKPGALARLLSDARGPENIVRLKARAELARSLMDGCEREGKVLSFTRTRPAGAS